MNRQLVELVISAGRKDQLIRDGLPQIALSGRSNVGKSSALNRMLGRKKLARVSAQPGKTVTVNYFRVDGACYLVDLPGYGFARVSEAEKRAWSRLTDGYFQNNASLAAVLQLIDLKTGPSRDDETMLDYLTASGVPFVVLATKADKLNATGRKNNLASLQARLGDVPVIPFSSLTGEGADTAWNLIEKLVAGEA
ncbi:MAG: YihA family ribosome biogenesis GTP-binding protein [Clostridia bacterium]|nr:YihA family ribosome biogenesis GTP-binding protein [Clostridia bacterium]